MAAVKVKALAVDSTARDAGIASALLRAAVQVYKRAECYLVYGVRGFEPVALRVSGRFNDYFCGSTNFSDQLSYNARP